jgi:hypothetical protein
MAALAPISRARRFCTGAQSRLICAQRKKGNAMTEFSRRDLMMGVTAAAVLVPGSAFASDPVIAEATIAARKNAPVVPKKVNKLYNLRPGVDQPNDMQFGPNGELWILDQKDPNKVATIDPKTGAVLASVTTECIHGSGITYGDPQGRSQDWQDAEEVGNAGLGYLWRLYPAHTQAGRPAAGLRRAWREMDR